MRVRHSAGNPSLAILDCGTVSVILCSGDENPGHNRMAALCRRGEAVSLIDRHPFSVAGHRLSACCVASEACSRRVPQPDRQLKALLAREERTSWVQQDPAAISCCHRMCWLAACPAGMSGSGGPAGTVPPEPGRAPPPRLQVSGSHRPAIREQASAQPASGFRISAGSVCCRGCPRDELPGTPPSSKQGRQA